MRHIRDPITGYCIICEKNNIRHFVAPNELDVDDSLSIHGSDRPRSSRRGYENGKKTIHVTSTTSSNGSDRGKSTSLSRPSSSASISSDTSNDSLRRSRYTARSTSKLIIIENGRGSSPPPRYGGSSSRSNRSPSPARGGKRKNSPRRGRYSSDPESGCCGKNRCCKGSGNSSKTKVFDESTAYDDGMDRCCGYRNNETASFGAGTWGIRRWCAPLLTLLVLGALAGMGVGIYHGVKAHKEKVKASQKVVSFIKNSQAVYIIVGVDQPCSKVNQTLRPGSTTAFPNCFATTTRIVAATRRFVPPTDPDWVSAFDPISGASEFCPVPFVGILLIVWAIRAMIVDRNFIPAFVEI